jgi:hypothetical protein
MIILRQALAVNDILILKVGEEISKVLKGQVMSGVLLKKLIINAQALLLPQD